MVGLAFLVLFIVVGIISLWIRGIDEMHEEHPEYKGWELYNEEEENEKD